MTEVDACPVCGCRYRTLVFVASDTEYRIPGNFPLVRCGSCGSGYLAIAPSPPELAQYYPPTYSAHAPAHRVAASLVSKIISLLSRIPGDSYYGIPIESPSSADSKALDIGTGAGAISLLLGAKGWRVTGLEFSRSAARIATRAGVSVIRANVQHPPIAPESFDLVIGSQILEHLYRPVDALREYYMILRKGGTIIIGVPNFESHSIRVFGPHAYASLSIPRHLVFFSQRGLGLALEAAGFSLQWIRSVIFPTYLPSALLRAGGSYRRIAGGRAAVLVSGLSLPWDVVMQGTGRGAGLVAVAKKA